MSSPAPDILSQIAARLRAAQGRVRRKLHWLVGGLSGLLFLGLVAWARQGTNEARGGALLVLFVLVGGLCGLWWRARAQRRNPRRALRAWLRPWGSERAEPVERAYRLLTEAPAETGASEELMRLHLSQLVERLPAEQEARWWQRRERGLFWGVSFLWLLVMGLVLTRALFLTEGALVWTARGGQAGAELPYVGDAAWLVEPPASSRATPRLLFSSEETHSVPEGSVVQVRMAPRVSGRQWVLTDGTREELFVSDGSGLWQARWTLLAPTELWIAARFSEVKINSQVRARFAVVEDEPPRVVLHGAPQELALEELTRLDLQFLAVDDHGLVEVALVLRSGNQEQRTELVRLDGKEQIYRGGHALVRSHPFLARAFLPVRVSVEARDAPGVRGPQWGKSEEIVLVPPAIGGAAAQRYESLVSFRQALVQALAEEVQSGSLSREESERARDQAIQTLRQALSQLQERGSELQEPIEGSLRFFEAQVEALERNRLARTSLESVLLASDALVRELGTSDAKRVAEEMGLALEELAVLARQLREQPEVEFGGAPLLDRWELLSQAARNLGKLSVLGRDLGSVAEGDLGRMRVALDQSEMDRVERIALHLAARLKRGTPSFGAKGGAGVESGSGSSQGQASGDAAPSDAPAEYRELAQQAERLAQEHARELSELDRLLEEVQQALQKDKRSEEKQAWKEKAEEVRRTVRSLPDVGGEPGSVSAEAALGKNQAQAFADALEGAEGARAVQLGREAVRALRRAARLAEQRGAFLDPQELSRQADRLEEVVRWVEEQKDSQTVQLRSQMGEQLREQAAREKKLAEQADELAERAQRGEAPLPQQNVDALRRASRLMQDAARAWEQGQAEEGRRLAESAQSQLERATPQSPERAEESPASEASDSEGTPLGRGGEVPKQRDQDRTQSFRERVQRGLSWESGDLAQAVRRYAEELK